jgi:G-protein signaling modulator 2
MHPKEPEIFQRLNVSNVCSSDNFPDDSFFEMLMKCQGARIEDQRSALPNSQVKTQPGTILVENVD